ncbi:hypothetical protein [Myceligenerans crystallogenes]|uniref:Uncharacterized protein n=1 Tax=Myceligenerans crystallogenes TaxID=316335 RepID=A0ABP4ZN08_9MICO
MSAAHTSVSAPTWCAHFPWLRLLGPAGDPDGPTRWDEPIPAQLPQLDVPPISELVDVVVDDLRAVPVGTLFPRIDRATPLLDCHVPPKRVALLAPHGIERFGDLADRTVGELAFIPRMGPSIARKTIGAFIRTSRTLPLTSAAPSSAAPSSAVPSSSSAASPDDADVPRARAAVGHLEKPLAARLDSVIRALDEYSRDVFLARRLPAETPTFGEIAARYGYPDTRVATSDARTARLVRDAVVSPVLRQALDAVIPEPGATLPLGDLLAAIPGLTDLVPAFDGRPAWTLVADLTGAFVVEDDVVRNTVPPPAPPRPVTRHELVAAVLARAAEPLEPGEIYRLLTETGTPLRTSAVNSTLTNSDLFVRVDRRRWALAAWKPERLYTGTRDVMRRILLESGDGELPLARLAARIQAEYDVAPATVRHYAKRPPFELADGVVRFTGGTYRGARQPQGMSLGASRRMVRRADGWAYQVVVWNPAKRQRGLAVPNAVHTILPPVAEDGTVELPSRLGPQRVLASWDRLRLAPIERFVADLGLRQGDRAWVIFKDDGTFDVERADAPG